MGACQNSNVIELTPEERQKKKHHQKDQALIDSQDVEDMIAVQKAEFPDMKEWKGNRFRGIGIKKMRGYKCNLPIDKLNEKREEFWGLRNSHATNNYKTWRIINQACVYDELRANMLLEEYELTTAEGCINHIIDKNGNHYIIPNYCINDPYYEKQFVVDEEVEEERFKVKMYESSKNMTLNVEISNLMTGHELKEEFMKLAKISDDFKLRLFFSGNEIKDDQFLYQYNVAEGYKIQVMKLPNLDKGKEKKEKNKESNDKHKEKEEKSDGEKKKKRKKKKTKNKNENNEEDLVEEGE